eukprot:Partr_v1_DN23573_c0_g1_i1_m14321 putative adenine phosphoribosyltransferase
MTSSKIYTTNDAKALITAIPDFPQPGILFRDIFPVFLNPLALEAVLDELYREISSANERIDMIAGLDARGFLIGPILALRLGCAFVPIRKKGKLPGDVHVVSYQKEYGVDSFEMQKNSIKPGDRVVIVDDLLATGGSASAGRDLVEAGGGLVTKFVFLIELLELKGRDKLIADKVYSLWKY